MRFKCPKKKKKMQKKDPSEENENRQESMPSESVPTSQSSREPLPSAVGAVPQDHEASASDFEFRLPSGEQLRSSARMSAHLNVEITPRRSAVKGAVRNFSLPLRLTPSASPDDDIAHLTGAVNDGSSSGIANAGSPITPTRSQLTTNLHAMEYNHRPFTEGQPLANTSSNPVNRRLDFTQAAAKGSSSTLTTEPYREGKNTMPVYVPTKVLFTKELFPTLNNNLHHLHLDLFWPNVQADPRDGDVFPLEDLEPICNFRRLRSLKITGMMQSYQKYIWQAAWLCPNLKELALEMALEPCIRSDHDKDWPTIKGKWQMKKLEDVKASYHGDKGKGIVRHNIGYGEYLDTLAIMNARKEAESKGSVNEKLSVTILRLTGFVVDADPFKGWFDPNKLREVDFANDCIDAGFGLSAEMLRKVKITCPGDGAPRVIKARAFKLSDL
ncbi:MAG: hypothetical protein M1830_004337, partial [Pleopsidium flavum]